MYSSGTTGKPKCMVHSVGGTLLKHLEEHQIQGNRGSDDTLMYFTTTGWMMWNWMVSALALGEFSCRPVVLRKAWYLFSFVAKFSFLRANLQRLMYQFISNFSKTS